MKHIIVGGDGFLGKVLTKELEKQNKEVIIVDIKNISGVKNFTFCDIITDFKSWTWIPKADDIIYILAARQYHDKLPRKDIQEWFNNVNVKGTKNILEYALKNNCKNIIFFSTDMVYGLPKTVPIDESHSLNPVGYYGKSKKLAEEVCEYYRGLGMNITIFRPRLIIGPGRLGVLKILFSQIKKGGLVPLIGSGENHYQMISVFDCVEAMLLAEKNSFPNEAFNLGSDLPPSIYVLLMNLINIENSSSKLLKFPAFILKSIFFILEKIRLPILHADQYMIADKNYILDISKANKILGWIPKYADKDMLVQAYQIYIKECC